MKLGVPMKNRISMSVCASVTICATLVNIQIETDAHTDNILTSLYDKPKWLMIVCVQNITLVLSSIGLCEQNVFLS